MVDTGPVPMTGMVEVSIIVLVKDSNDPDVEEKEEGEGDVEERPEVDPDSQEVVLVEKLPWSILLDRKQIQQRHLEEIVESAMKP